MKGQQSKAFWERYEGCEVDEDGKAYDVFIHVLVPTIYATFPLPQTSIKPENGDDEEAYHWHFKCSKCVGRLDMTQKKPARYATRVIIGVYQNNCIRLRVGHAKLCHRCFDGALGSNYVLLSSKRYPDFDEMLEQSWQALVRQDERLCQLDYVKADAMDIIGRLIGSCDTRTLRKTVAATEPVCENCSTIVTDSVLICGSCQSACYCSKECQRNHWKAHKHKRLCQHVTQNDTVWIIKDICTLLLSLSKRPHVSKTPNKPREWVLGTCCTCESALGHSHHTPNN